MWTNWSGGLQSRPRATDRPLDEAGVVAAVRRAAERGQRIRPVGARWSWSPLAVSDDVGLDTSALTGVVALDATRVRVRAGEKLHDLLAELARHGFSLDVVPRGDGVTVGGAVSTGTHGSGAAVGSLSSLVRAVRLVDGRGELRRIDGPDLDAVRTSLGALGVLTEVELAVVPERTLAAGEELRPLATLLDEGFLGRAPLDRARGLPRRARAGAMGGSGRGRAGRGARGRGAGGRGRVGGGRRVGARAQPCGAAPGAGAASLREPVERIDGRAGAPGAGRRTAGAGRGE